MEKELYHLLSVLQNEHFFWNSSFNLIYKHGKYGMAYKIYFCNDINLSGRLRDGKRADQLLLLLIQLQYRIVRALTDRNALAGL